MEKTSARIRTLGSVSDSALNKKPENQFDSATAKTIELQDIEVLPEYEKILEHVKNKLPLILVTGGAGTGKSTFVRWLFHKLPGTVVIAAPTGVAAVNAGGKTIHSLFKFPPAWITEEDIKVNRQSVLVAADVLIVDEISMVNSNLFDSMNLSLQKNRKSKKPFGGLTVIAVGDLFQLPPVVTSELKPFFDEHYGSPHFFAAKTLRETPFEVVELSRSFRQKDPVFTEALNQLRDGQKSSDAVRVINRAARVSRDMQEGTIWLAPTNAQADRVNSKKLSEIRSNLIHLHGEIKGKFREDFLPVPKEVLIKLGAQVMIKKNIGDCVNGDIGKVESVSDTKVTIRRYSDGKLFEIGQESWTQYEYQVDPETRKIKRIEVGTYTQFPIILAWAMTIHKSQGLTLSSVHLELDRGVFATGQTYVALSRCREMAGISITRPLLPEDVKVDAAAIKFYEEVRRLD